MRVERLMLARKQAWTHARVSCVPITAAAFCQVLEFLEEFGTEQLSEVSPSVVYKSTKIFVNGVWVGIHRDIEDLVNKLRQLRRQVPLMQWFAPTC